MNAYRVKPMLFPWSPVVYLTSIVTALLLGRLAPLVIDMQWHLVLDGIGIAVMAAGIWLALWGYIKLMRYRTGLLSSSSTTHLVTSGPYGFSRNPVYLGYTVAMLGAGLFTGNAWLIAAAVVTALVIHLWIIRREEKHLLSRFGCDFESYCRRTRAWL